MYSYGGIYCRNSIVQHYTTMGVTINRNGPHQATPDHTKPTLDCTGPIPGRKWLIISLHEQRRVLSHITLSATQRHCVGMLLLLNQFTLQIPTRLQTTAPDRTGRHRTAPNPRWTAPGQKWLIISHRWLLRVDLRCNSEPTVLGLHLNKQETLSTSITRVD